MLDIRSLLCQCSSLAVHHLVLQLIKSNENKLERIRKRYRVTVKKGEEGLAKQVKKKGVMNRRRSVFTIKWLGIVHPSLSVRSMKNIKRCARVRRKHRGVKCNRMNGRQLDRHNRSRDYHHWAKADLPQTQDSHDHRHANEAGLW